MAYINASDVKRIRDTLKKTYPNLKWSVTKDSGGLAVNVAIMAGNINFGDIVCKYNGHFNGHVQVNTYYPEYYGSHENLIREIVEVIKTAPEKGYYDNSDAMIDYFDTAFYFHLEIGKWNRPYEFRG